MRNAIGAREIATSRDFVNNQLPVSNDTSRSPIPIDEETYKNMHSYLPKRMDAASSLGHMDKSRSREQSMMEESASSTD